MKYEIFIQFEQLIIKTLVEAPYYVYTTTDYSYIDTIDVDNYGVDSVRMSERGWIVLSLSSHMNFILFWARDSFCDFPCCCLGVNEKAVCSNHKNHLILVQSDTNTMKENFPFSQPPLFPHFHPVSLTLTRLCCRTFPNKNMTRLTIQRKNVVITRLLVRSIESRRRRSIRETFHSFSWSWWTWIKFTSSMASLMYWGRKTVDLTHKLFTTLSQALNTMNFYYVHYRSLFMRLCSFDFSLRS